MFLGTDASNFLIMGKNGSFCTQVLAGAAITDGAIS